MKVIGVDIGGTKTAIGIIDDNNGKVYEKLIIPSKSFGNDKKSLNLFNTKKFTKNIEKGYQEVYDLYQQDLPPRNII